MSWLRDFAHGSVELINLFLGPQPCVSDTFGWRKWMYCSDTYMFLAACCKPRKPTYVDD